MSTSAPALASEVGELDLLAGPPLPVRGDDHRPAPRLIDDHEHSSPTSRSVSSEWRLSP